MTSPDAFVDHPPPAAAPWYLSAGPGATIPWLTRLKWATAGIDALVLLLVALVPSLDLPLDHVAGPIAASGMGQLLLILFLKERRQIPGAARLIALLVDIVLLTGLLELTGGPSNPFVVVYAVFIAVAAFTLGRPGSLLVGASAATSFALLVYWHVHESAPVHHRLNDFPTHLYTMWIAVAASAELVAFFIEQGSAAFERRARELEAARAWAERNERLASLTTLSAGAAHELSTPLATIAVAARELERAASAAEARSLLDDAQLIRTEVDRCRTILNRMSGRAGGTSEAPDVVDVAEVVASCLSRLPSECGERVRLAVDGAARVHVPPGEFEQAVASLIDNAFDASGEGQRVSITVRVTQTTASIAVSDEGSGMSPDILRRAGEPFFTTKEPGRGMGLGLFLARVFAERCGGGLSLESNSGTIAVLHLPLHQPQAGRG